MEVIVDGTTYRIQFEHTHKNTKTGRDKLGAFRDLRGVTQCVLVTDRLVIPTFAICSALDNFSRAAGRKTALRRALRHPLVPWQHALAIQLAYDNRPRGAAGAGKKEAPHG